MTTTRPASTVAESTTTREERPTSSSKRRPEPTTTAPSTTATPTRATSTSDAGGPLARQVIALVNTARADAGCDPVTADARLTRAAQRHSDDMAEQGYLDHTTPDGVTFDQRIRTAGYDEPAAENIAQGTSTSEAAMDAWLRSEGHRANILNCDYTTIGVGANADGWYWTQDFGY